MAQRIFSIHKEFSVVHAHILENCGFVLAAARNAGINIRIAHSHLAQTSFDIKYPFRKYGKYILKNCHATKYLACGNDAGKYLFDEQQFTVLPNAVDTTLFSFNKMIREMKRKELGLEEQCFVLGNVARFHPVKNQIYLIDIFDSLLKEREDAVLILVGVGPEQDAVREKVKLLGLESKVLFLNVRTDVNELLQAMDVFVFPSKLEGLPLSLVEAQATGLPCYLSDRVATETAITDLVEFIPLDAGPEIWASHILKSVNKERKNVLTQIREAHYDIQENAEWLQNYYLGKAV